MDPQVSGSFIPKQSLSAPRRGNPMGLLLLLSILLFILSLVGAAGVFAYGQILKGAIANSDQQLTLAEGAFEPAVIDDLSRLDNRLQQTEALLTRHLAPSAIFDFLSTVTLERVQFTKFSYKYGASGSASITLSGIADSYSTVALQSDKFGSSRLLKNVVFSGVGASQAGKVSFSVQADLDPSLYIYAREDTSAQAITPLPPAAQSQATSTGSSTTTRP
jgi:Tfp pilus assembly protein PilN